MAFVIRHAEPEDHGPIIAVLSDWWGFVAAYDKVRR